MGYYYAYCFCRECMKMNLKDINRYDNQECYCTQYHRYINKNDKACSLHFEYNETLSKQSGCYITTAICKQMGLEDNCEYLNKLRNFRENVLKKDPNYYYILYEYDIIGPIICENLKEDPFKNIRSLIILENFIKPIIDLIDNREYTEAINKYTEMVNELKSFYNIPDIDYENIDINIDNIGKGYKLKK